MQDAIQTVGLALEKVGEKLGIPNLDPTSGKIFITGGTGVIGHRVALRLLQAGYPDLRLGVHDLDKVEDLNKLGAEIADFNWEREDTYDHALKGVKSVLCTPPYVKHWNDHFQPFLKACDRAGVKHFVKLSFYHARAKGDVFQNVPLVKKHAECDRLLAGWGSLPQTIISASHFMSNALVYQGSNLRKDEKPATFYGASGGKGVNYVSPNDVAEVAVRVLLAPKDHLHKEYTLTGPAAVNDDIVAGLLSKHLQKPVMYVDQPLHTFEDGEKMGGDPKWLVDDLVAFETIKASGAETDMSFVSNDIETVCGHQAETFEEYLQRTDFMTPLEAA